MDSPAKKREKERIAAQQALIGVTQDYSVINLFRFHLYCKKGWYAIIDEHLAEAIRIFDDWGKREKTYIMFRLARLNYLYTRD